MPFLLPNQQRQSTEGISKLNKYKIQNFIFNSVILNNSTTHLFILNYPSYWPTTTAATCIDSHKFILINRIFHNSSNNHFIKLVYSAYNYKKRAFLTATAARHVMPPPNSQTAFLLRTKITQNNCRVGLINLFLTQEATHINTASKTPLFPHALPVTTLST